MKLIAIYKQPEDSTAFDEAYFNTHLPLLNGVPGLEKTEIIKVTRTIMGDEIYLMAIMHFADKDARRRGMRSPEMAAAGENLDTFAAGLVTLLFSD
jgi:uncharacterized protein (TIGR02118 family)